MPYAESRERFAETLEIVRRAWTEDTFSYDGAHFQYHDVGVVPKPYQKPHPPIRVAATSADTFPAIGAQGLDIFAAVRTGTLSELAPNLAAYREAYATAGTRARVGSSCACRCTSPTRSTRPSRTAATASWASIAS